MSAPLCECGCGETTSGVRFVRGHNSRCRSEETKKKLSECSKGNKNRLGKTFTPEQRAKIAKANTGHVHSEEQKRKISESLIGNKRAFGNRHKKPEGFGKRQAEIMKGNKRGTHSHGKRCFYESPLQGRVCFRSTWEKAYAEWLDEQDILWVYEDETFDLGDATYTPDFYLIEAEKYIEIKGYMSDYAKDKMDKFAVLYPLEKLDVLFANDLLDMGVLI